MKSNIFNNTIRVLTSGQNKALNDLPMLKVTTASNGQTIIFNNGIWANQNITSPVNSVFGRTGAIVATEGDYALTQLSDVTLTTPSTNQILQYNGSQWANANLPIQYPYYNTIESFIVNANITAIPNTYYVISAGATITIPPFNVNEPRRGDCLSFRGL